MMCRRASPQDGRHGHCFWVSCCGCCGLVCLSPCELRLCPVECVPGSSCLVFATQQVLQASPGIAIRTEKHTHSSAEADGNIGIALQKASSPTVDKQGPQPECYCLEAGEELHEGKLHCPVSEETELCLCPAALSRECQWFPREARCMQSDGENTKPGSAGASLPRSRNAPGPPFSLFCQSSGMSLLPAPHTKAPLASTPDFGWSTTKSLISPGSGKTSSFLQNWKGDVGLNWGVLVPPRPG